MKTTFTPMTEEQRAQAKLKREADQQYARTHLKTEYVDQQHWSTLASKYSCKLPGWWYPITDIKYMRRVAKKAGVDINVYVESTGFGNLKEFAQANQKLTAVAGVGLLLEWVDEINLGTQR
jgi:hypothetical protein